MYNTFLTPIFIWCLTCMSLTQTVTWDLATSSPTFGKSIELRCSAASCCSSVPRKWTKSSTDIMINGVSPSPSKYSETIDPNNNYFSLIISNLDESDVDVQYTCQYQGLTDQKTLTMNDSFIYSPTNTCPMKVDGDKPVIGTLNVEKAAPWPSLNASYGGKDWSSYLTVTGPTPITGNTKFYTISASLNRECTCGKSEKFTLSVLTASGTVTKNVCDSVDFCKCGQCAGQCFGYSILGTAIAVIVAGLVMKLMKKVSDVKSTLIVVGIFAGVGLVISGVIAGLIGYFVCPCRCKDGDRDPLFILVGLVVTSITALITIIIFKQKDTKLCFNSVHNSKDESGENTVHKGKKPSEIYELDTAGNDSPTHNLNT